MKKIFFLGLLLACSSPYYNGIYNAQKLLQKGEKAYEIYLLNEINGSSHTGVTSFRNKDIEFAIKKSFVVLQKYGETKEANEYSDQAFFIIAKSSFYLGNYDDVIEAVHSLQKNTPSSLYLQKALVFLSRAYFRKGDIYLAQKIINQIKEEKLTPYEYAEYCFAYSKILEKEHKMKAALEKTLKGIYRLSGNKNERESVLKDLLFSQYIDIALTNNLHKELLLVKDNIAEVGSITLQEKIFDYVFQSYETMSGETKNIKKYINFVIQRADIANEEKNKFYFELLDDYFSDDTVEFLDTFYSKKEGLIGKNKGKIAYLVARYYDVKTNFVDSAIKYYNFAYRFTEGIQKQKIKYRKNFISNRKNVLKKRNLILAEMDKLSVVSPFYQQHRDSLKKLLKKVDFSEGVFFYENKKYELAKFFFKEYSKEVQDKKTILANYYLASIWEEEKKEQKADSIYRKIYSSFPSERKNKFLLEKLGIKEREDVFSNKMEGIDGYTRLASLLQIKKEIGFSLDSLSTEKLDFLILRKRIDRHLEKLQLLNVQKKNTQLSLSNASTFAEEDSLIRNIDVSSSVAFDGIFVDTVLLRDIAEFKVKHPKSLFTKELSFFELDISKTDWIYTLKDKEKNTLEFEDALTLKKKKIEALQKGDNIVEAKNEHEKYYLNLNQRGNLRLLVELKSAYEYKKKRKVDIRMEVNSKGIGGKVFFLSGRVENDLQEKIKKICKNLVFNKSSLPKRNFFWKFVFDTPKVKKKFKEELRRD